MFLTDTRKNDWNYASKTSPHAQELGKEWELKKLKIKILILWEQFLIGYEHNRLNLLKFDYEMMKVEIIDQGVLTSEVKMWSNKSQAINEVYEIRSYNNCLKICLQSLHIPSPGSLQ